MNVATVTSKGQITIPAEIRSRLGIRTGDQMVFFERIDGGLGIHVRRPKAGSGKAMLSAGDLKVPVEDMSPQSEPQGYEPGGLSPSHRGGGAA